MAKLFHVNPTTGNASACKALKRCPFGGLDEHFTSFEAATLHSEKLMGEIHDEHTPLTKETLVPAKEETREEAVARMLAKQQEAWQALSKAEQKDFIAKKEAAEIEWRAKSEALRVKQLDDNRFVDSPRPIYLRSGGFVREALTIKGSIVFTDKDNFSPDDYNENISSIQKDTTTDLSAKESAIRNLRKEYIKALSEQLGIKRRLIKEAKAPNRSLTERVRGVFVSEPTAKDLIYREELQKDFVNEHSDVLRFSRTLLEAPIFAQLK